MKKLLVANRSEIAIRVFRAATELGLRTVAVYSYEDRFSLHRFKSDESFLIGPPDGGEPVKSYLNISNIIALAKEHEVDAIHPGYGFLSENAELARACEVNQVKFVGPTPLHLEMFGDKMAAKRLAEKADVPIVPGTPDAISEPAEVRAAAKEIGYPLIIKASFGGGGRGMRVVRNAEELAGKLEEAQREAGAAFGKADVFIERYIPHAKHIEVQILGDAHGNLVHLWERDCSVQRRHQKVVEVAPAINISPELRKKICDAAVRLCQPVNYRAAGTVEFLLDVDSGEFYFIEVNPRIQVEHTVTEMVTGIDLVKSQILITDGHKLHEPPLNVPPQDKIETRGVAVQCRITTEDPENHFIPDYGRLSTYRSAAGFGVRLDGGSAFGGAVITPYFDSLLVKLTTWAGSLEECVKRMDRALREFRVRGVKTNIPFLENLIHHPTFAAGDATTTFIDNTPELFRFRAKRDRATKILGYLGDVIINGRPEVKGKFDPKREMPVPVIPAYDRLSAPPPALRQKLLDLGSEKFCDYIRKQRKLFFTDTTMRDAHQSLLATRVRTHDMLNIADAVARLVPNLFSLEMWGGATFDTSMRFLNEDPWDRLIQLRTRIPNILFQMLLRASNAVGYTNYPDNVVREFIKRSATNGIDVFRVFDSLNWTANMKVAMEAVREHTDAICEGAICYTGDILDPNRTKFSLKYYVKMAKELVKMGTHILGIKDMAGLCKPYAAFVLVKALREEIDVPIHFHTHDTSGINAGSVLRAADAGVDIVDAAIASMSGTTSQPNLNSLAAALRHTQRDAELNQDALDRISEYWAAVRHFYYPFEEGLEAPTADVYHHEMPGGQYTNLLQQAKSLGLGDRWHEVCDAYAAANQLFGDIVKVTPSSKVVGDMALFMVTNNLEPKDILSAGRQLSFPKSVVEMMQGLIGQPEEGWPKVIQKVILDASHVQAIKGRPGAKLAKVDFNAVRKELAGKIHREPSEEDVLAYLMYPQVYIDFEKQRARYDNTSVIPTPNFFFGLQPGEEISVEIEEGKTLIVKFLTSSEVHEDGTRTVFFELNGQPREVNVPDHSVEGHLHKHPKADADDPNHVAAPMPGKISAVAVKKGQAIKTGERLLSIEAMKMETAIYSPREAKVADILVKPGSTVEAKDLLVVLE
ncbi:MAG TPA: pyruvate carboxylase [Tepidisphaeraceae bacterium]|jgi:pyruvate carboxylase|nr:pyruvate carboxylase [Tepidisphaeraceae bacterium]